MHFRVNLKMKKQTLCCCFTWIVFIKLNFTVAFLLIKKTWDGRFIGNIVCTPPPPATPPPLLLLLGRGVDSLQTGAARTVCRFKRELDEKERGSVFELS